MKANKPLRTAAIILSITSCMIIANATGDYPESEALEVLYAKAQGGDSVAQQKHTKLLSDLTVKAEQGDMDAQYRLGYFYSFAPQLNGSKVDYVKGAEWFAKSAEQGHTQAQFYLGYFHFGGMGVDKNLAKGLEWLTKSASSGDENTQYLLGMLYLIGDVESTGDDNVTTIGQVVGEAIEQGNRYAQLALGVLYLMNREDARNMGDATKGFEWLKKSAEQENAHSQRIIGICYEKGVGVTKDSDEAKKWYAKAKGQQVFATEEIVKTETPRAKKEQEITGKRVPPVITETTDVTTGGKKQSNHWLYVIVGLLATVALGTTIWKILNRKKRRQL
ncbi:MAG: sel1 repeat family protein [Kiritimatiellaeota bacterium]|nr:sel1 repeat family protein [Kiritimatiellota bacterium]